MWFMFVVPFIIFFVTFLAIAGSLFRSHKHSKNVTTSTPTPISTYPDVFEPIEVYVPVTPPEQPKEEEKTCEYCGSKIKSGETKCEACGAKVKK